MNDTKTICNFLISTEDDTFRIGQVRTHRRLTEQKWAVGVGADADADAAGAVGAGAGVRIVGWSMGCHGLRALFPLRSSSSYPLPCPSNLRPSNTARTWQL